MQDARKRSRGGLESQRHVEAIRDSGLTIYDHIEIGDPALWVPIRELEDTLNAAITGASLEGLPIRTRSKAVKELVCRALGYPVPSSFKKTRPRFPGQLLDIYVQKSSNLQIWNENISPTRRYAIVIVGKDDIVARVKVVTGRFLAQLDNTGTLTRKYQARIIPSHLTCELITPKDTDRLQAAVSLDADPKLFFSAANDPQTGLLLPIGHIYEKLLVLIGRRFQDVGRDQERNRSAVLHRMICQQLKHPDCRDDGQFPDLRHQLLEIKLQTASTIDLGLVRPDSEDVLAVPKVAGRRIRQCDVRYVLFYAATDGNEVTLTHMFMTTGERFFTRFPKMQGRQVNKKLQMSLPADYFNG